MNEQRKIIYAQRQMVLDGEDISGTIKNMMESAIDSALDDYIGISQKFLKIGTFVQSQNLQINI